MVQQWPILHIPHVEILKNSLLAYAVLMCAKNSRLTQAVREFKVLQENKYEVYS